jgi:small-conductance mechanosensitive channel
VRRVPPFVRGLAIIALISLAIVVLNLETSLATATVLLRVAFFVAVAVAAYLLWRDFGRREISLWPARSQWIFYGAVALLVIDLGWYFLTPLGGLDALVFFIVAAASVYAGMRTWRRQRHYG